MTHRKLRASAFIVTSKAGTRLNRGGVIVARQKGVVYSVDAERTVKHVVESSRLEGVDLGIDFAAGLFHEVVGRPIASRPKRDGSDAELR
jgi:hypothetical protein